jgi:heme-degrading monooxygenase HmoA
MPFISADDGYLTVFNIFETDTSHGQEQLLVAMRDIIDNATYPGWISSTLHGGQDNPGTLNYIQWRSKEDLEARYAGKKFRNETVPLFNELSTSVSLLQTEVVFTQRHPTLDGVTEISPNRDDYTVVIIFRLEPENQKVLVDTLAQPDEWLMTVPGYRSHSILRGTDDTFVVNYAQWDNKQLYDTFHNLPEDQRPPEVQEVRANAKTLVTSRWSNSYRVVHSRSAESSRSSQCQRAY